ncbi:hypothetical protein [Streptomyces massasporeus]|uniref:hypothetical protein n=1 Tax=Streptomyces massasporeus TaxID=67324 RepID=UPI00381760DB
MASAWRPWRRRTGAPDDPPPGHLTAAQTRSALGITAARENTREERDSAARLVHRRARDRDDLHQLLDVLGLDEQPRST